jgi:hypothetical protein
MHLIILRMCKCVNNIDSVPVFPLNDHEFLISYLAVTGFILHRAASIAQDSRPTYNSADHMWHMAQSLFQEPYELINICLRKIVPMLYAKAIKAYKQSSPATPHGGAWRERRYSSYSF